MMKRIAGLFAPALVAGFFMAGGDARAQNCSGSPNQNTICAGPTSGGSGFPSFRSMVTGDIPAGTVTGSSIASGTVTNSNLANAGAKTVKCNDTGSSAAPQDCTPGQTLDVLKTAPWPDTSEVVASGAAKWNPLFFGNAGTGIVHRFNRVFVGEATASSSDFGPVTTKDWLETLVPNTVGAAMFAAVDTTGDLGVLGGSRCSDFRTVFGSSSGGCQGGTFYGYNDDTTGNAIGCGVCGAAIRKSGAPGDAINQMDAINGGSVVDILPFSGGVPNGSTIANLMTAGAVTPTGFTNANTTAAWVVGAGLTTRHRKGGVCQDGAIDVSLGAGGDGVCVEMARNMSIRWLNSGGTTDGEIWANASGVKVNQALTANSLTLTTTPLAVGSGGTGDTGTAWSAFTASPTCGTATITANSARSKTLGKTTFIELDLNITALGTCGTVLTVNLPNTANSGGAISGRTAGGLGAVLQITSGGTTAAGGPVTAASWATGQVLMSGVYENQ